MPLKKNSTVVYLKKTNNKQKQRSQYTAHALHAVSPKLDKQLIYNFVEWAKLINFSSNNLQKFLKHTYSNLAQNQKKRIARTVSIETALKN